MSKTKKQKTREYIVPMEVKMRGHVIVEASSPEEATEQANAMKWLHGFESSETIDWDAIDEPEVNE
jgi:hypothetical protein